MPEWFKNQWFLGGRHARNIAHVWISVLRIFVQDGFRDLRSVGPQSLHKNTVWVVFWGLMFEVILAGGLRGEKRKDLKRLWPEGPPDIYIYIYICTVCFDTVSWTKQLHASNHCWKGLSLSLSLYIYIICPINTMLIVIWIGRYWSLIDLWAEYERKLNGIWMESEFDWSSLLMFQFCRSAAVKHTVQLGKSQSLDRDSSVTFEFGAQLARFVGSNSVAAPSPQSITSCCSTWVGFQGRKIWTESERFGNNFWNLKGIWM